MRIAGDALQQCHEVAGHPRDCLSLEQIGAVFQPALEVPRRPPASCRFKSNFAVVCCNSMDSRVN